MFEKRRCTPVRNTESETLKKNEGQIGSCITGDAKMHIRRIKVWRLSCQKRYLTNVKVAFLLSWKPNKTNPVSCLQNERLEKPLPEV